MIDVGSPVSAHYCVQPCGPGNPQEYTVRDRLDVAGELLSHVPAHIPRLVYSANAQPCLRFNQNESLLLPMRRANNGTSKWGWAAWVRHNACVFRSHLSAESDSTRAPVPMTLERSFRRT